MRNDNYNNKNSEIHRVSTNNFPRGSEHFKPSPINYSKNDKLEAMVNTIKGTLNQIKMKNEGRIKITNDDIDQGIKRNAKHLELTEEDYHAKMEMITNPKPENNPNPDSDPEKLLASRILETAELIRLQKDGLEISNDEILKFKENSAERLGIDLDEYNEKLDMILNPQPETDPSISDEVREPFV